MFIVRTTTDEAAFNGEYRTKRLCLAAFDRFAGIEDSANRPPTAPPAG